MNTRKFSVMERIRSFRFAIAGIEQFMQREHNSWLHFLGSLVVVALAIFTRISKNEILALVFAIGFVWVAELFNTCIEKMMDFISVDPHPEIKFIKDLAAGAVLIAAVTALVIGLLIFIPKWIS
jgi:diacylglycerol kinase (ATP)